MTFLASLTALVWLATAAPAHAEPVTVALFGSAFAATFVGQLVTLAITTAVSVGVSLLAQALRKPAPSARPAGIQFDIEVGDDAPIGFTVGTYATAGTRKYIGAWGSEGGTPNAYLTDVIQIGDLPAPGDPGLWVNGEKCTILWGETPAAQGYPVEEFRVGGKDHLWVRYRDGTETTADSVLLDTFGAHPDRPWQSDMIGRGCPHLIVTALFNRDLFPGQMQWLAEPPPTAWYDVRKDDTAGGSGTHRWDDPATWESTDNPAVVIYNLIRGVTYGDEWVFGGQSLPAFRLPAANWMAAANACDTPVDLAGGGTEKQFRCGYEIRGDMEPLAVIEELLKACNGRLAEVGGIFKLLVGAPGSAVYAFTDGDIVVTEGQSLTPFPPLAATHNGIEATYPEPAEMWASKDAPARYSSELEAEDGDRRLAIGVAFAAVPFGVQVQRHTKAMLDEERRFRRHSFFLPPEAWLLEPNDVVSWTSARNGYAAKKFLIEHIVGRKTLCQQTVLKEIDPADYDWDAEADEQPSSTGVIGPIRPPAQPMTGWQALPYIFVDADGTARRPGIEVKFAGGLDDVRAVRVEVRLAASGAIVFDGEVPYDIAVASPSVALAGTFLRATEYEARGIFLPFSGRQTSWSAWLAVTTPDVGLTEAELDAVLQARLQQLDTARQAALAPILAALDAKVAALGQTVAGIVALINERIDGPGENALVTYIGNANAAITDVRTIADGLADMFVDVFAGDAVASGNALLRMTAGAGPGGAGVAISLEARAVVADIFKRAGIEIYAVADAEGGDSGVILTGNRVLVQPPSGDPLNALLITTQDTPRDAPIATEGVDDVIRADLTGRQQRHRTVLDGDAEMRAPVGVVPMDYTHALEQDATGGRVVAYSDEFLDPQPSGLSTLPGAINILRCSVLGTNPVEIAASLVSSFVRSPVLQFRDQVADSFWITNGDEPLDFSALDFVPGNLLLAFACGHAANKTGTFGTTVTCTPNSIPNWNAVAQANAQWGSISNANAVRALWKVADGSEQTLSPFAFGGSAATRWNACILQVAAFDFLGGVATLGASPTATIDNNDGGIGTQTIEADSYDPPVLAFSWGAFTSAGDGGNPPSPDQNFSETPDGNYETPAFAASRARLKFRLFGSSPADVTTSIDSVARWKGLVSGSIYLG